MMRFPLLAMILAGMWAAGAPARADETETIECPAIADTTVLAGTPSARIANGGQLDSLGAQGNRQFILLNFDTSKLEGREVVKATLKLYRRRELLTRIGIGTVCAPWFEGRSIDYEPCDGCACYQYAGYDKNPDKIRYWAWPGSDFGDVAFGNGGTRWASLLTRMGADSKHYEIDVPPAMVQALAQGLQSGGLCVSDEFNREPIATIAARESANPPVLVVETRKVQKRTSQAVKNLSVARDSMGIEWVEFDAPSALGFEVLIGGSPSAGSSPQPEGRKLEPWALPTPGTGRLRAALSLSRQAADSHVYVRAVEAAADWSGWEAAPLPPAIRENPPFEAPQLPRIDLPRKFDAPFVVDDGPALSEDGRWMRSAGKTWFDPFRGPVTLESGRNEFIAFQVILCGAAGRYQVALADWKSPGAAAPAPTVSYYLERCVRARVGQEKYGPEIAVPLAAGENMELKFDPQLAEAPASMPVLHSASSPTAEHGDSKSSTQPAGPPTPDRGQKPTSQPTSQPARRKVAQGVWVELYVPNNAAPGLWRNRVIVVRDGVAVLDMPIELRVVDATLPGALAFDVSIGSQRPLTQISGAAANSPAAWSALEDCYRTAHRHRVTFVYDPVHEDGKVESGFAPEIKAAGEAAQLDFDEWDRRFARYLDGSAFRDLPREGQPLDYFALPLCPNWPMLLNMIPAAANAPLVQRYHYRPTWSEMNTLNRHGNPPVGSYIRWPIENAFTEEYRAQTRRLTQQFVKHLRERGWKTEFLISPNQSMTGKREGCWWNLEVPQVMDDYLALRFWLGMYRAGGATPDSPVKLRATLSVPHFSRNVLDGNVDISTMDLSMFDKQWHILAHAARYGRVWSSGWLIEPEFGWSVMLRWAWAARLCGARGLVVPESVADTRALEESSPSALLYPMPGRPLAASLRLKGALRAQQDMEWIEVWRQRTASSDTPEGYYLSLLGAEIIARLNIRPPKNVNLLPVFELPGNLDTVVFEELRRGLRSAAK